MKNVSLAVVLFFIVCEIMSQTLESYLEIAINNNPEIHKLEVQHKIILEKIQEENIPNTELGVGYFVSEPETRTGTQRFKIRAKQMLPWFGVIKARKNYVASLADAKHEDIVIAKRKLMTSVSQTYYNLYKLKAKQDILNENIELLKTYEILAITSLEIGNTSAIDVLLLQIRISELEQSKQILQQEYFAEQTYFNKLLNRDKSIVIDMIQELTIPEKSMMTNSSNLALHPELIKYEKLYISVEKSEFLNKKESRPMIGLGLDYVAVSEREDMFFNDNGKDILMPTLSLSIPVFAKRYKSKSKQNELKQQEIYAEKQTRKNNLEILLQKAISKRTASRISFETQARNLNQIKNADEILIKSYETETIDFKEVLEVQELQLRLQLDQIEAICDYYNQTVIINYLTS